MRYEKGYRDSTRQHILDVASAQFRENGIAAAGIAGIMSAAGLTNGAFYTAASVAASVAIFGREKRSARSCQASNKAENGVSRLFCPARKAAK